MPSRTPDPAKHELWQVAALFLRLGATAFGGPAAHIALMEQEVVYRRKWLAPEEFLDLLGAVNLIPGPSSTEMAIFIGYRRAGWRGLVLGGLCFILPAALIVSGFGWAYVRYGSLPQVGGVLYGVKPVVIAVVAQALWSLGKKAVKTWTLAFVGLGALVICLGPWNPIAALVVAGIASAVFAGGKFPSEGASPVLAPFLGAVSGTGLVPLASAASTPFSLPSLFLVFLKTGSVLFGSGYVLLAFLRDDLVHTRGWLTESQLLDAVAVGQFTPGPVFTTATFIGYILGGPSAAFLATVGIFAPSFVLVALSGPIIPRLRKSRLAGAFLDGVNVASLALMAAVGWRLGAAAVVDGTTAAMALGSAVLLWRTRINPSWLILAGAVIGLLTALHSPAGWVPATPPLGGR